MAAPVADGLAAGIGKRHVAGSHRMHRGTEHAHALQIGVLALNVGGSHENLTLHVHQCTHRGRGDTVLAGTGLGDDASLAHALSKKDLSDGVVDFVGTGVVQVLALQEQAAAIALAHATGLVECRRTAHVVLQQLAILLLETLRLHDWQVSILQRLQRGIEDLGHIGSTESSVEAVFVYLEFVLLCHFFY